jgi:hypothetical protein
MKTEQLNHRLSLVANLGILVGLAFVAIELNQNTRQLSLELEWQINQKMFENNRDLLGDNPTPIYAKSVLSPEDLTYEEFQVASAFVFNFLGVAEDRFFLYQQGLLTDQAWKDYVDDDIALTLGYRFAQAFWRTTKGTFEPEFVQYIDTKLREVDANANYQWYLDTLKGLSTNSQ